MPDSASGSSDASGRGGTREERRAELRSYWQSNLILIGVLLFIWAVVSYGCSILCVEWLNRFHIGDLPVGFWFAQQGSMYVFVILIFVYAFTMDRLDRKYGVKQ